MINDCEFRFSLGDGGSVGREKAEKVFRRKSQSQCGLHGCAFTWKSPWHEVVEGDAPGLPFVAQALGIAEHDVLHATRAQGVAEAGRGLVDSLIHSLIAGMELEQLALRIEGGRIGEDAAEGRLPVGLTEDTAERSDCREGLGMGQTDLHRLPGPMLRPARARNSRSAFTG